MSLKTIFVGSSTGASVVPGWEDYEHKLFEMLMCSAGIVNYGNKLEVTNLSGLNLSVNTGFGLVEFSNTNLAHGRTYKAYVENTEAVSLVATDDATSYVILKITPSDPNEASTNLATIEVSATQPANSITLQTIVASGGSISSMTPGDFASLNDIKNAVDEYSGSSEAGKLVKLDGQGKLSTSLVNVSESRFGSGADGAYTPSVNDTLDFGNNNILIKEYSSVSIPSGVVVDVGNVPDNGGILVLLCTGDVSIEGKLDGKGKGSRGGLAATASRTGGSQSVNSKEGNQATLPFNVSLNERLGEGGKVHAALVNNEGVVLGAVGAAGSATDLTDGVAGAAVSRVSAPSFSVSATNKGVAATVSELLHRIYLNTKIVPGCGGASGGAAVGANAQNSVTLTGTTTASSGEGGRGGLSVIILCRGDLTIEGEIDLSGSDADVGSVSLSGQNGGSNNWSISAVAGSSAGGSPGTLYIEHRGAKTDGSATYTLDRGAASAAVEQMTTAGTATANTFTLTSVAGNSAVTSPVITSA